ncbi:hypothetical protein AHAS_Ahas02G0085200 [Arachis hypogaea]
MSKAFAEKWYYKQKGVVRKVIDKYVGETEMLESKHVLRVDQEELETVIPQVGGRVKIVNGAYRGSTAKLLGVDTDHFCAKVQIEKAHDSRSVLVVAHNAVNQALVATAIGLGVEYFRCLLQSNCGVSVLDFIPRPEGGSPDICLDRLNQTPGSPVAGGKSGGRDTNKRIILVCNGSTQGNTENGFPFAGDHPMNMLGVIQSQKSAELLLDLKVSSIISSPNKGCFETAMTISKVQEAADCLGADCVPRYVELKQIGSLDDLSNFPPIQPGWLNRIDDGLRTTLWDQSEKAWQSLLDEISNESSKGVLVAVAHPAIHIALMGHCLNMTKEWLGSFHLDEGSVSVLDFPDGPKGRGVIRPNANKNQLSVPKHAKRSLLEKTCDLIKNFPEYLVVVSVARKTDGRHWADLL